MGSKVRRNPSLTVLSPGFLTTVQDLGRYQCAHWGISPSGAADQVSLRLGNLLLGNPPNTAALEMTLTGGTFRFDSSLTVALTGSDFGTTVDGVPIPAWQTVEIKAGQVLCCGPTGSGARCYLCIAGGIAVPSILSSASTHLLTALGGFGGRPLMAGDRLECGNRSRARLGETRLVNERILDFLYRKDRIRVTPGPQRDFFSDDALLQLSSSVYRVKEASNRMGLRLSGPRLNRSVEKEMTTEGVSLGAVQVPPDGEPIVLAVEHPTTGGYPKIANVILADMHRIGQCRPRDEISFELVSFGHALALLAEQEALLTPQCCLRSI